MTKQSLTEIRTKIKIRTTAIWAATIPTTLKMSGCELRLLALTNASPDSYPKEPPL